MTWLAVDRDAFRSRAPEWLRAFPIILIIFAGSVDVLEIEAFSLTEERFDRKRQGPTVADFQVDSAGHDFGSVAAVGLAASKK